MDKNLIDLLSLIVALISLLWTWYVNTKSNKLQEQANQIQLKANEIDTLSLKINQNSSKVEHGMIELSIRSAITDAKKHVVETTTPLQPFLYKLKNNIALTPEETHTFDHAQKVFKSAEEDEINAYEEACAKYITGKVDYKTFEHLYHGEIKQLVENPNLSDYFFPTEKSPFQSIIDVYTKWHQKKLGS